MTDKLAPAHIYQPKLGTGIQWQPGQVNLWQAGKITASAQHTTATPHEYWRNLTFAQSFPDVTHWWFRSAWTQRVRFSGVQGMITGGTLWGYVQFVDEQTPAQIWSVAEGARPEIFVPFPPNEVHPVNIPLRLALARLAAGVIADQVQPDTWQIVSSLVHRDELHQTFSDSSFPWQLEGIAIPLLDEFCRLQGLSTSLLVH